MQTTTETEYTWVSITEILRETEKAVLVLSNGTVWLPKGQVEIYEYNFAKAGGAAYDGFSYYAYVPYWLYRKNKPAFGWAESMTFQLPDSAKRICKG